MSNQMPRLKGAIFSLRDVVLRRGKLDAELMAELGTLIVWLRNNGVQPVFVGNNSWFFSNGGNREDARTYLAERWGDMPWYIHKEGTMPPKPTAAAMEHVLADRGWHPHEAIYIGNTEDDMKTARNGKLMFLNAVWHGEASSYGYQFDSPLDVARFVDCFCLGIDDWFWAVEDGDLRVYALAPFSTLSSKYQDAQGYSHHARNTAKDIGGDAIFWGRLLASSIYLSGLGDEINYVTSYPGHSIESALPSINDALSVFSESLRKTFIPDLILRHTTAIKSQTARQSGNSVDHVNQINTICLNPSPTKNRQGDRYANPPLRKGKTVLVVDDFCTQGNSLEAARAYIENTGARAICLSWLKTINTDYKQINPMLELHPYERNIIRPPISVNSHNFSNNIRSASATSNLKFVLKKYYSWKWPD